MKSILYILVTSIFFLACNDEPEEMVEYFEPKGKKSKELGCWDKNCEKPFYIGVWKYDESGNLKRVDEYFDQVLPENQFSYDVYYYNNEDKKIKYENYIKNGKTGIYELHSYTQYIYDNEKIIEELYTHVKSNSKHYTSLEYSKYKEYDLIVEKQDDILLDSLFYKDEQLIIEKHFFEGELLHWHNEYEYNEEGKLTKKWFIDSYFYIWDKTGVEAEYFYDENGNLVKSLIYDPYFDFGFKQSQMFEYY
ncbi:MAG: hypothetical protein ACOCWM_00935 [Cyclobacteriaceae bacterium]